MDLDVNIRNIKWIVNHSSAGFHKTFVLFSQEMQSNYCIYTHIRILHEILSNDLKLDVRILMFCYPVAVPMFIFMCYILLCYYQGSLIRQPTPYPKEMREKARHLKNLALRQQMSNGSSVRQGEDNPAYEEVNIIKCVIRTYLYTYVLQLHCYYVRLFI